MYSLIKRLLFCLEAERSHRLALTGLRWVDQLHLLSSHCQAGNAYEMLGIRFPNRIGLAAGLDKNGDYIRPLSKLGFGFLELGTVTPKPQPGNPKPRLFRIPAKEAIINRLGFNNKGVDYLVAQVQKSQFNGVLGINIGKNFSTPLEKAVDDYVYCLRRAYEHAHYITINISSPNTQGLRDLQAVEQLNHLLSAIKQEQQTLQNQTHKTVPIVVKLAPDLSTEEIANIAKSLLAHAIEGVIATNTTISRPEVMGLPHAAEAGGLSGKPLFAMATNTVRELKSHLQDQIPIIGVGGIHSAADAAEKYQAGASLLQLYTGFIYHGPKLIAECVKLAP
jgi:dihydroorotate dehydrogenase